MPATGQDVDAVKAEQRATWNELSTGWEAAQEDFERGAAAVTARLLELAELCPGQVVLDVATGHGEPALTAARLVGRTGRVVGVDIASEMLAIARRRAAGAGNVEFIESDLESLDLPAGTFHAALSRFGLMFATDHAGTFAQLRRLLVPGGVLAAAVWGPPDTHLMSTGPAALSERLGMPPPPSHVPTPFSMSDRRRLHADLAEAGFVDVSVTEHTVPFWFASLDDYVRFNRLALPPGLMRAARRSFEPRAIDEIITGAVEQYASDDGSLPLPSTALTLRAVAPR